MRTRVVALENERERNQRSRNDEHVEIERVTLRIPSDLKARIRRRADQHKRSVNQEIIFILQNTLDGLPTALDARTLEGLLDLRDGRTVSDEELDNFDWDSIPDND